MIPIQLSVNRTNIARPSTRPHLTLYVLWLFHQQGADEVPGFLGDMWKSVLVKFPVALLDVLQGVKVILSSEGWQTTQPGRNTKFFWSPSLNYQTDWKTDFLKYIYILMPSRACWLLGDWIWTSCETHTGPSKDCAGHSRVIHSTRTETVTSTTKTTIKNSITCVYNQLQKLCWNSPNSKKWPIKYLGKGFRLWTNPPHTLHSKLLSEEQPTGNVHF